ncbi:MAG: ParB/RepB/Spo0J family partition protein [Flavobacteriales bacterium]
MTSNNKKGLALGRGLGALLSNNEPGIGGTTMVEVTCIEANPFNPRTHFELEALEELTASIKALGIIQPLTLRQISPNRYQLISGERRLRASQMAGLTVVPAYIRVANDQSMLEMALVENIQRENLNAIEIGLSYHRLIEECKYTQAELGHKISKSRSDIANHLRLLKLPAAIQAAVRDNELTMGHARALLSISDETEQLKAFEAIKSNQLSVREVEQWGKPSQKPKSPGTKTPPKSAVIRSIENQLKTKLGLKVQVNQDQQGKGKITLSFNSLEQLNMLIETLSNS